MHHEGSVKVKGRFTDADKTAEILATTWPELMPSFFALVSVYIVGRPGVVHGRLQISTPRGETACFTKNSSPMTWRLHLDGHAYGFGNFSTSRACNI